MKRLFLFFLLSFCAIETKGSGPIISHEDPKLQLEFENIYQDIRNTNSQFQFKNSVTISTSLYVGSGNANNPSYSFSSEKQTGLYSPSATTIGVSVNGSEAWRFTTSGFLPIDSAQVIYFNDGSVSAPGVAANLETNTGMYRIGSHDLGFSVNGTRALELNSSQQILGVTGSASVPTFASQLKPTSGMAINSSGGLLFPVNGVATVDISATKLEPDADNTIGLGESGFRFVNVWAVNGTIQTSTFRQKTDVREFNSDGIVSADTTTINDLPLSTSTIQVPRGIVFKWKNNPKGRDYIGFAADDMPLEAHPLKEDGTYDMDNVYTGSVIGVLCSSVRDLQREVKDLQNKVSALKAKTP